MQGDFSFDDTFGNLVTEVLPSCLEKEVDSLEGHDNIDGISNGHMRAPSISNAGKLLSSPLFPEVDALLSLFKNSSSQLVEQKRQVYRYVISTVHSREFLTKTPFSLVCY